MHSLSATGLALLLLNQRQQSKSDKHQKVHAKNLRLLRAWPTINDAGELVVRDVRVHLLLKIIK